MAFLLLAVQADVLTFLGLLVDQIEIKCVCGAHTLYVSGCAQLPQHSPANGQYRRAHIDINRFVLYVVAPSTCVVEAILLEKCVCHFCWCLIRNCKQFVLGHCNVQLSREIVPNSTSLIYSDSTCTLLISWDLNAILSDCRNCRFLVHQPVERSWTPQRAASFGNI